MRGRPSASRCLRSNRRTVEESSATRMRAIASNSATICRMAGAFSRLPAHEQRRLRRLGAADLEALALRRLGGEPLQYIEGSAAFTDFEVEVDARVLVPRPETEGLLELAVAAAVEPGVIVDLGTGSGVLAIAANMVNPEVKRDGLGGIDPARMQRAIDQVVQAFELTSKPTVAQVFDSAYLPPAAARKLP